MTETKQIKNLANFGRECEVMDRIVVSAKICGKNLHAVKFSVFSNFYSRPLYCCLFMFYIGASTLRAVTDSLFKDYIIIKYNNIYNN